MKSKNIPEPLPPLHEKEEVSIRNSKETDTGVLSRREAEKLIKAMEDRTSGRVPNIDWLVLPKNEGTARGQYRFHPQMLRLGLDGKTISCFGSYGNDESLWLIEVRFLAKRPTRQPVRFEITAWFNPTAPTGIPLLFC